ncbi:MAG: pirin family protein [Cyclobacteriaceae bacterium]
MVKQTLYAHMVDMGGIPVRQPLPTANIEQIDPFLLLHHHIGKFKENTDSKDVGVGPHPHRGFSPVTFIYQGDVHHRDSRNNSSVVKAGGVQWMNAGMGIIHSERPSSELTSMGGTQEIIQLWINTPQSGKMNQPEYQAFQNEDLPKLSEQLSVVAGKQDKISGPAKSEMPIAAVMGTIKAGEKITLNSPYQHSMLYILNNAVRLEGHGLVEQHNLVVLEEDTNKISLEAETNTKVLFLSADPLNEPLATYGPFVMNSQSEIMEAMRDYQMGKMGVLIEEFE